MCIVHHVAEISAKMLKAKGRSVSNDVDAAKMVVFISLRRMCGKIVLYHLRTKSEIQQKRLYLLSIST